MGWGIWAEIDAGGATMEQIGESYNYTYNTSPMLYDVGIDWHKLTGKPLSEVVPILKIGLAKLKAEPKRYEAMNPKNGWGSYDGLCKILGEIIAEFETMPKAILGSGL